MAIPATIAEIAQAIQFRIEAGGAGTFHALGADRGEFVGHHASSPVMAAVEAMTLGTAFTCWVRAKQHITTIAPMLARLARPSEVEKKRAVYIFVTFRRVTCRLVRLAAGLFMVEQGVCQTAKGAEFRHFSRVTHL